MDEFKVTPEKIDQWAHEARQAAAVFDNEWDRRAVDWDGFLTTDSIVVECGSFKGRWALQIAQRYNPFLYCFEPQGWALLTTRKVLDGYSKAAAYQFGLWTHQDYFPFEKYGTDGSTGGLHDEIAGVFRSLGIDHVDLMMVNIEGAEYTLIPHMFANEIFPQRLAIQMHDGDEPGLRGLIELYYTNLWDYGRVLSAWERKP